MSDIVEIIVTFLLMLVFGFFSFCFFVCKEKRMKRRFRKMLRAGADDVRSNISKSFDAETLRILFELFSAYPDFVLFSVNNPVILELNDYCCLVHGLCFSSRLHRGLACQYSLKPWAKRYIDDDRALFNHLLKKNEIILDDV